jgi:xylulokinase
MERYLASVDVGTSGSRCSLFDTHGRLAATAGCEYGASYPNPGWVEQDAAFLIDRTMEACRRAIGQSGIAPADIASIAFSTQRSVTCAVDEHGVPLRPLISWQDARTAEQIAQIRTIIDADEYYRVCGLPLGTTWILTKVLWMREHEPELYRRTARFVQNQDIVLRAFGATDDYTDISCMAFYGTWDVGRLAWYDALLGRLGLSPSMFGKPTPAGTHVANIGRDVAEKTGFAVGTPVCVGAGDQNCSVVGMGAIRSGMGTVTLGTAGLAILCVDRPIPGFGGMMITNHAMPGRWEVEGLSNAAASSLRWFRDVLNASRPQSADGQPGHDAIDYTTLTAMAETSPAGAKGLLYLPYLATAATPRWNADARAAFLGLSFAHGVHDMTRAVMEGVALEIRDIMEQWLSAGMQIDVIRIGGGATRSPLWRQIQADVYGRPVELVECEDSTGLGCALLAGVGAGIFHSIEEGVASMIRPKATIEPDAKRASLYEDLYRVYAQAYDGLQQSGTFHALAQLQASASNRSPASPKT